jgi:hypothetical protein
MGDRRLILAVLLAGCPSGGGGQNGDTTTPDPVEVEEDAPRPTTIPEAVVYDFERGVLDSQDAMLSLFDFAAVGEFEILLHRYDLLGRDPTLPEKIRAEYAAEDGTPYPPERERKNIGRFYDWLIAPAINEGDCVAMEPTRPYNRLLGVPFEEMPPGNESHEALRQKVNSYLEDGKGGVIAIRCPGGERGLALVWTRRDNERGYDIITIYDDGPEPWLE